MINVAAGLAGVAGISLQILNPPALAMGEGGTVGTGANAVPRTQARTAVITATINLMPVPLPTLTVGLPPLVSASISVLSTPLVVTLARRAWHGDVESGRLRKHQGGYQCDDSGSARHS